MTDNNFTAENITDFYCEALAAILEDAEVNAVQKVVDTYGVEAVQVLDALEGIEPTYDDEYEDDDD